MIKKILKFGVFFVCLLLILGSIFVFYTDRIVNSGFMKKIFFRKGFSFKQCSGSLSKKLVFSNTEYLCKAFKMNVHKIEIKLKYNGFSVSSFEPVIKLFSDDKSANKRFGKFRFWKALISDFLVKNGQLHFEKNHIIAINGKFVDSVFKFSGIYNKLKVNCVYTMNRNMKIKFPSIPIKSKLIAEKFGLPDIFKKMNGNISVSIDFNFNNRSTFITLNSDKDNRLSYNGFRLSKISLMATFLSEDPEIANLEVLQGKIGTIVVKGKREIEGFVLGVKGEINPEDYVILNEIVGKSGIGQNATDRFSIESLNKIDFKMKINDDKTFTLNGDLTDVELSISEHLIKGSDFHLELNGGNLRVSTKRSTLVQGSTSICWRGYIESLQFPTFVGNSISGELKTEIEIIDMKVKSKLSGNVIDCSIQGKLNCKIHNEKIELDADIINKGNVTFPNGSKLIKVDCKIKVSKDEAVMTGRGEYKNGNSRPVKLKGKIDFDFKKMIVDLLEKRSKMDFIKSTSFRLDTYDEPLENFKSYFPKDASFDKKSEKIHIKGFFIDGFGRYSYILSNNGKVEKSFVLKGFISLGNVTKKCPIELEMKFNDKLNHGKGKIILAENPGSGNKSYLDFSIVDGLIKDISGKTTLDQMRELLIKNYEVMDYIPADLKTLPLDLSIPYTKEEVKMIFSSKGKKFIELVYSKSERIYKLEIIRIKKQIPLKYTKFKLLSDIELHKNNEEIWILPFIASLHGYQIKTAISLRRKLMIKFSSDGYMLQDFILALHKDGKSDYYGVIKGDLKLGNKEIQLLISGEKIDIMEICRLNNIKVLNIEGDANLYLKVNYGRKEETLSTNGKIEIFVPPNIGFGHIIVNEFNPEILKFINPEVFNKIPFKKIYADFKFNRKLGIDVNNIKMTGPVINLVGHGELDMDGKIDFDFSAGMSSRLSDGIKEKQFNKFKSLFYRSGNFIVDFSLAGSVYYPKFIPNFSGKTYKYFLKNIYRDPNILLKLLFSF